MRHFCLLAVIGIAMIPAAGTAQQAAGPYSVLKNVKAGGDGGFDYVYADAAGRRLYVPRSGAGARVMVFNLDTFDSVGTLPNIGAHGAAVDPKSGHGFATANPVPMWDTKTLTVIKTIPVMGGPDGILFDPFNARVWILSHNAPNVTLINAADGTIAGTIDLGGAPEQAVTDGKGHVYVDLEDKDSIAVVDAAAMKVTARYSLGGKASTPAGLAFDIKNHILFATCRMPAMMVILNAEDGKILDALPTGTGTDGAVFNPTTMEAFSSNSDGTLTIVKENSPTSFVVEQNLKTMVGAKTLTLDSKTNHVIMIAAEYGPAPTPAATPPAGGRGGRGGSRGPMLAGSFSLVVAGKP
jgi:DNA-binding beta-propeller fold protein YncE